MQDKERIIGTGLNIFNSYAAQYYKEEKILSLEMSYKQLKLYVDNVKSSPTGYSFYMLSLMFELYSTKEIICIFKEDSDLIAFKELISENFIPNATFLAKKYNEENTIIGFLNNYILKDDKTSYYVCQSNSCSQPINDLQKLKDMILGVE